MTTTIWQRVYIALSTLGVPVAQNVYIPVSGAALPDLYLVYFEVDSTPSQHADDSEDLRNHRVQVTGYSRTGLVALPDIDSVMTAAGFTRGPRREMPYNQTTRHFGLALEYNFLEVE